MKTRFLKLLLFPLIIYITVFFLFLQIIAFIFYMPYVYVRYGDMTRIKGSKIWAFEVTNFWYDMN